MTDLSNALRDLIATANRIREHATLADARLLVAYARISEHLVERAFLDSLPPERTPEEDRAAQRVGK